MTVALVDRRPFPIIRGGLIVVLLMAGTMLASIDTFTLLFFATYAAVGAFLAFRRPDNAIGWLLIAIALGFIATTTTPASVDIEALRRGAGTPRDAVVIWLSSWGGWATYVGFVALTIIFPSGRLPEARGRRSAIVMLAGTGARAASSASSSAGWSPRSPSCIHPGRGGALPAPSTPDSGGGRPALQPGTV